eukprot:15338501-Alexandrium_andersonii.AAC.1
MPPGTGDDGEAFERFVYLQTAKQCKGEGEMNDGPPEDSEGTLWVDSDGVMSESLNPTTFSLKSLSAEQI